MESPKLLSSARYLFSKTVIPINKCVLIAQKLLKNKNNIDKFTSSLNEYFKAKEQDYSSLTADILGKLILDILMINKLRKKKKMESSKGIWIDFDELQSEKRLIKVKKEKQVLPSIQEKSSAFLKLLK